MPPDSTPASRDPSAHGGGAWLRGDDGAAPGGRRPPTPPPHLVIRVADEEGKGDVAAAADGPGGGRGGGSVPRVGGTAPPAPTAHVEVEDGPGLAGAPWYTRPRAYFRKMQGGLDTPLPLPSPLDAALSTFGAFCAILAVAGLDAVFQGAGHHDLPLLVASFGASAVLLFGVPESKLSQPRNFLGGQVVSAVVGCVARLILGRVLWLSSAAGMAASLLAMQLTSTLHPPGGATALIAASAPAPLPPGAGFRFVGSVAAGAAVMQVVALAVNNLHPTVRYPSYWVAAACGHVSAASPLAEPFASLDGLDARLRWLHSPAAASAGANGLRVEPLAGADFWQGTCRPPGGGADDGALLAAAVVGDFTATTTVSLWHRHDYDQAGLMVRVSPACWLKVNAERNPDGSLVLATAVTNAGWTDLATAPLDAACMGGGGNGDGGGGGEGGGGGPVPSPPGPPAGPTARLALRVTRRGGDCSVEWGPAGPSPAWTRARLCRLHSGVGGRPISPDARDSPASVGGAGAVALVGVYALAPVAAGFVAEFDRLSIGPPEEG